jgi:type II secretory ATPase GspE/PulE/Tfp pilus assembly ATPase PilB-like protein
MAAAGQWEEHVLPMAYVTFNLPADMARSDHAILSLANQLLIHAITQHASDIHIEPFGVTARVRLRIDGLLQEIATIPLPIATQINTRLKVMAELNIAEKRLPQDGRFKIDSNSTIDIRISTCPTRFGEKIALRLLYPHDQTLALSALGMTSRQEQLFLEKLSHPEGLILVTGPTGSGKTMTLYSALMHLNHIQHHLITIEDPVEIELQGINQININPRIGLDFQTLLPAILRQDPDIIMIGEIRDQHTASIAMDAAETGHLVLSTLHARNTREVVARLCSLGIHPHRLNQAAPLIISQRLIRRRCLICHANQTDCQHCYQGYRGRTGIFELLLMNHYNKRGQMTLREAGWHKVNLGITSREEINRVLGSHI